MLFNHLLLEAIHLQSLLLLDLLHILLHLHSFFSNILTINSDSPLFHQQCLLEQFKVTLHLILGDRDSPLLSDLVFVLDAFLIEFVTLLSQLH